MSDCTIKPKLKSCPFCGCDVELSYRCIELKNGGSIFVAFIHHPTGMGCFGDRWDFNSQDKDEVIKAWNTRADVERI